MSKHNETVWIDMAKAVRKFSREVDPREVGNRKGAYISVWKNGSISLQLGRAGFDFDVIAAIPIGIAQNGNLDTISDILYAWEVG